MKLTVAILALSALVLASEYINGIYLGSDVTMITPQSVAVRIAEDGTVTAYRGALVPGLHDRYGREVRIKKVEIR